MSSASTSSEQHAGASQLSDIILGAQDGLVSVLGLVLGLVASTNSDRIVLAGGLAMAIAETISMGAVAYTSRMAERDRYQAELNREREEIHTVPDEERQEVEDIYRQKGFEGKLLSDIVDHITSNEELWLNTMMTEELDLRQITKHDVRTASLVVGTSTLVGSVAPLLAFIFLPVHWALTVSLILAALMLLLIGMYQAKTTIGRPWVIGLKLVAIGVGSALAGYLVGLLFKT